jgi:signal transduction histidine kinase
MRKTLWLLIGLSCWFLAPWTSWAQRGIDWRIYKAADGLSESYCSALSFSPRGNLYVKHGDSEACSVLDGYDVRRLPSPAGGANFRIYEGRTNQLWALYPAGIQEFHDGKWFTYEIPQMKLEKQADPLRSRPISLVPIKRGRVLFLFLDALMVFESVEEKTSVVRRSSDLSLGKFLDMSEARDGGIWIGAEKGVARLPSSVRSDSMSAVWSEYPSPSELGIKNFQKINPDDDQGIVAIAETMDKGDKVAVGFDGEKWEVFPIAGAKIRQSWRGLDHGLWAQSIGSIYRIDEDTGKTMETESPLGGQILDVAIEPKGVFWLATSEGLIRHAPWPWRTPRAMASDNSLVHAMIADGGNGNWFAGAAALTHLSNGVWSRFPYPNREPVFQPSDTILSLPDGRLAVGCNDQLMIFDPGKPAFSTLQHPSKMPVRLVGKLPDGHLCVRVIDLSNRVCRLDACDGKGFAPYWQSAENWGLGPELYFCVTAGNGLDIWLGGAGGLGLLRDGKLKVFNRSDGEVPESPSCLLEFADGRVWCGGLGRIHQFDGKNWSIVRSGFDRVNAMIQGRNGTVWVASSDGVHRFKDDSWIQNGVEEGLPSDAVYEVMEDPQGNIWAGSTRGLSLYHASSDIDPPRTQIISPNNQQTFPMDIPVTLRFFGQDKWQFTRQDRLLFSYRLNNLKWTPFNPANTVTINEFTPGKQRLEARSMDRNGNIDRLPAVFDLTIFLPWYFETRLLVVLTGALVISLIFGSLAINRHLRLKRSYAEVERIVGERTRELEKANQALIHSEKMRALGTLAAGIAHDFNSILSIIKGSAQIIESNLQDREKVTTRLNRIKTVVDQGAEMVKAMLGYSRISSKELVPTQINELVEETVKLLGDRFLKEVDLHCELSSRLPEVPCATHLLRQMLLNLILNAADAISGPGRITIRTGMVNQIKGVATLAPSASPHYVFVAVDDNGCGIPPEIQSRIFEPFFTTKAFSSRRGTGLGLSMVYEFAKDLGFGLQVESTMGQGSSFAIFIPASEPGGELRS